MVLPQRGHNMLLPLVLQGNVRTKSGVGGGLVKEALLDNNKHRKASRKRVHAPKWDT